jgi:hypothetical protein
MGNCEQWDAEGSVGCVELVEESGKNRAEVSAVPAPRSVRAAPKPPDFRAGGELWARRLSDQGGLRGPQDDNASARGTSGDGWYVGGRGERRPYGAMARLGLRGG